VSLLLSFSHEHDVSCDIFILLNYDPGH
jgi:hypothetical protein